jgi:mono/diheme cytochrome c family protein
MDNQGRYKAQQLNTWFADTRAMRLPVAGTVARGELRADDHYYRGIQDDDYASEFPMQLTASLLARGRQRYDIHCAPCHGMAGYGDGIVARRADRLEQGTWVAPASLHVEPAYSRPVGHLYNTITNGIRSMPGYASQIPVEDRWAIVSYLKALQRSQRADLEDVPPDERQSLR